MIMRNLMLRRSFVPLALLLPLALVTACGSDDDNGGTPDTGLDVTPDGSDNDTDVPDGDLPDADVGPDVPDDGPDTIDVTPDGSDDPVDPPPDRIEIPGLAGPLSVAIDAHGIPHIDCATDNDCAAVLGYLHARDRFAQMDIRRRLPTGRISSLVGELALDIDITNRQLFTTVDGIPAEEAMVANATDDERALFEAYARGVNAWLDDLRGGRNGATLQDEYRFPLVAANVRPDLIPNWTVADSYATILALIDNLTNESAAELSNGEAFAQAPSDDAAFDLYAPMMFTTATSMEGYVGEPISSESKQLVGPWSATNLHDRMRAALPVITDARSRLEAAGRNPLRTTDERGSNNWALAPSITASGNALFSNDPHLTLSNPGIWYFAHLDAVTNGEGTFRAAGATFAGLPYVILGQNAHITWGATVTTLDLTDVYLETLSEDGTGVVFNGETVPFVRRSFTYTPAGAAPVTREALYVPHHGPILSIDEDAGTAVSIAWTGNRITTDGGFLVNMMRATSVEEAQEAVRDVTTIGQNWVIADVEGNIGWFPYNTVPRRPWASQALPSYLPLPGDGSAEWDGYLDYDDLPQLYNPARGFVATANNDMTGALYDGNPFNDGHMPLQVYADGGARQSRILEVLAGSDEHTFQGMLDLVADTYSTHGELLVPILLAAATEIIGDEPVELTDEQQAVVDVLRDWDFTCPSGIAGIRANDPATTDAAELAASAGCMAFHSVFIKAYFRIYDDEREVWELTRGPSYNNMMVLLTRPDDTRLGDLWFDDIRTEDVVESRNEILRLALQDTGDWLATIDEDPTGWIWGKVHTLTLRADLFSSFGVPTYDSAGWTNDGGMGTVDVAQPAFSRSNTYSHGAGASMRFVCELPSGGPQCTVQLPGGQRHYRDSPNYDDLLRKWLVNEPVDLIFDLAEAFDGAAYQLDLFPAE